MITEEITHKSILSQYYRSLPDVISVVKIDVCSVVASLVISVVESEQNGTEVYILISKSTVTFRLGCFHRKIVLWTSRN